MISRGRVYYTKRADEEGEVRESIAYCFPTPGGGGGGYSKSAPYLAQKVQGSSQYATQSSQNDAANGFGSGAPASANAAFAGALIGQSNVSSLQAFQGARILSLRGININTMGDEVVATDAEGNKKWSHALDGNIQNAGGFLAAPPIAAGDRILVGTLKGDVRALDAGSGKRLATWSAGGPIRSQPVVQDGWIYVGTDDGKLVGINTGDRKLTGWPTWGRDPARTGAM